MTREEFIYNLALEFAKQGKMFHEIAGEIRILLGLLDKLITKRTVCSEEEFYKDFLKSDKKENQKRKYTDSDKKINTDFDKSKALFEDNTSMKNDVLSEKEKESELQKCDDDYEINNKFPKNYDDITFEDVPKDFDENKCRKFVMSPVEYLRYKKFQEDHKECKRNPDGSSRFGAIGGGERVTFVGTGIGDIIKVKCEYCGTEVDLTDNSCW